VEGHRGSLVKRKPKKRKKGENGRARWGPGSTSRKRKYRLKQGEERGGGGSDTKNGGLAVAQKKIGLSFTVEMEGSLLRRE